MGVTFEQKVGVTFEQKVGVTFEKKVGSLFDQKVGVTSDQKVGVTLLGAIHMVRMLEPRSSFGRRRSAWRRPRYPLLVWISINKHILKFWTIMDNLIREANTEKTFIRKKRVPPIRKVY